MPDGRAGMRVVDLINIPDAAFSVRQLEDPVDEGPGQHLLAVSAGKMIPESNSVMGHGISAENGHVRKRRTSIRWLRHHDPVTREQFGEVGLRDFLMSRKSGS